MVRELDCDSKSHEFKSHCSPIYIIHLKLMVTKKYKTLKSISTILNLNNIPLIEGVNNIQKDFPLIKSSLFDENWSSFYHNILLDKIKVNLNLDILFDPQTSGGLLGFIPSENADICITNLKKNGYIASIIGEITKADYKIKII